MSRAISKLALALCLSACSHTAEPASSLPSTQGAGRSAKAPVPAPEPRRPAQPPVVTPLPVRPVIPGLEDRWSDDVASLVLGTTTSVHAEPSALSAELGTITARTRVLWRDYEVSADCETGWIEIEPRGWICASVEPSALPPSTEMLPRARGRVSGRVRRAATIYDSKRALLARQGRRPSGDVVGLAQKVTIGGVAYWKTKRGQYVEAQHIARYWGSAFHGVDLEQAGLSLPVAFAFSRDGKGKSPVAVREAPRAGARRVHGLDHRELVSVIEESEDGRWVRIEEGGWVDRKELRIARETEAPSTAIAKERWLDVDLDEQVIVAYEGEMPVYVSLVSTGTWRHGTPTGVFRIERKKALTTMNSSPDSKEVYSVANVPYSMYFHEAFALHGAFWHDAFGRRRSHGCINLAPEDARWIYGFVEPGVPAGWSAAEASEERIGSAVRVRNNENPNPRFRGYAAALEERAHEIASAD